MAAWSRKSRRGHEHFAALLEEPSPTDDPELGELLDLAAALRALPSRVAPRPAFRSDLRARLLRRAAARPAPRHAAARPARRRAPARTRRQALAGAGLALLTLAAGVSVSAVDAIPGQPTYGLKRVTESTRLAFATSAADRGSTQLRLAAERAGELRGMLADPMAETGLTAHVLDDMDAETRAGAATLTAVYRRTGDLAPLTVIDAFARDQQARLAPLLPRLSGGDRARAGTSLALLRRLDQQTVQLLNSSCAATAGCRPGAAGRVVSPPPPTVTSR